MLGPVAASRVPPAARKRRSLHGDTMLAIERKVGALFRPHLIDVRGRPGRVPFSDMLVLTRKPNQSIMIGDDIEVSVLSVVGDKVRIGIHAPQEVPVFRTEIYVEIQREQGEGTRTDDAVRAEVDDALDHLRDGG